jgi:uncharacterized protein YnzC (UPF0291/DUF896 family)
LVKLFIKRSRTTRHERYEQNKLFKEDTKQFYRHLAAKSIAIKDPPHMEKDESYRKSLWEEKVKHNEEAEWIRREEEKKEKQILRIGYLQELRKQLHSCQKLTIGGLLESIKYQIIG